MGPMLPTGGRILQLIYPDQYMILFQFSQHIKGKPNRDTCCPLETKIYRIFYCSIPIYIFSD